MKPGNPNPNPAFQIQSNPSKQSNPTTMPTGAFVLKMKTPKWRLCAGAGGRIARHLMH